MAVSTSANRCFADIAGETNNVAEVPTTAIWGFQWWTLSAVDDAQAAISASPEHRHPTH